MSSAQVVSAPSVRSMIAQCAPDAFIRSHLTQTERVLDDTVNLCTTSIVSAAELIADCFHSQRKLLICGNGGSAAESQHMAAELTHRLSATVIRRALPALALTTDTSFITACSNDDGFTSVFARQVEALGSEGDVLLGISTSGNSRNILQAFAQAREQGLHIIALTGSHGQMASLADIAIAIPSSDTQLVQEAHLPVIHLLCALVEMPFARG